MTSLFPDLEPVEIAAELVESLSADRRRTLRQRRQAAAGIHPLTHTRVREPAGQQTCGSCVFRVSTGHHDRRYPKCWWRPNDTKPSDLDQDGRRIAPPRYSAGAASDVRAWWPACTDWRQA